MSLLTALIFGIPSIVPEGGGLAWMSGKSGELFIDNDPADLAKAIERLGQDTALRTKLSHAASERLMEKTFDHLDRARLVATAMEHAARRGAR